MGLQQLCSSWRARLLGLISLAVVGAVVVYIAIHMFSGGVSTVIYIRKGRIGSKKPFGRLLYGVNLQKTFR